MPRQPAQILVLGMHRSGTSLLSGLLRESGAWFGRDEDLVAPNEENPRGFHEHRVLRALNDQLLHGLGCDWSELSAFPDDPAGITLPDDFTDLSKRFVAGLAEQAAGRPIGLKDPRLCLLVPCWAPALDEAPLIVFVHRDPDEIARSLATRNDIPADVAHWLTARHLHAALSFMSGRDALITGHRQLLGQPAAEMDRIDAALRERGFDGLAIDAARLQALVDPGLYRSRADRMADRERRDIDEWTDQLARGELPTVPPEPPRASRAVLEYERRTRFTAWQRLARHFRFVENRLATLEHPEEARAWLDDEGGDPAAWATHEARLRRAHLDRESKQQLKERLEKGEDDLAERARFLARAASRSFRKHRQVQGDLSTLLDLRADIRTQARDLAGTLAALRGSRAWKLLERPARLLMNPGSLGTGETGFDTLYRQQDELERLLQPGDSAAPALELQRSPLARGGRYNTSIILRWDGDAAALQALLDSYLAHHEAAAAEWLVVCQCSTDANNEVLKAFQQRLTLTLLRPRRPLTSAQAANLAAEFAQGRFLVFCNDDVGFGRPVIDELLTVLEGPGVGLAGAKLADEENSGSLVACLGEDFAVVGGFHEGYDGGPEMADLARMFSDRLGLEAVNVPAPATQDESTGTARQAANEALYQSRWASEGPPIKPDQEAAFTLGLVVTDDDPDTLAGDGFTALELAMALEREHGWSCRLLSQSDRFSDGYDCQGLDALLVLVDSFDLRRIRNAAKGMTRIAWARNWFERWAQRPWFGQYDLALCSSERARAWVSEHSEVPTGLLRIATNPDRFSPDIPADPALASDYCFTGSYWNAPRAIEQLDPAAVPGSFALYGSGWDRHQQFRKAWRGPLPYVLLPLVYAGTQILVDDANHVTRPWGSVNSRVFDALASGTLVLSNGALGAKETFGGLLPVWNTGEELQGLLRHFLANPEERNALAAQLRDLVIREHTYSARAREFVGILQEMA